MSAMKYGRSLERLIREVIIANPALGPVCFLKADVSDGFYHIGLRPTDDPKLGLVFTSEGEDEELVVIPLTLHMEWKNATHILHCDGKSGGSSKYSLALNYPGFIS